MQWWEVNDYLEGMIKREHTPWESARFVAHTVACMFAKGVAKRADQWMPFPWEEEEAAARLSNGPDEAYMEEMRARIRQANEELNRHKVAK